MSGLAPSRLRHIERLRTQPGTPCELPKEPARRCSVCECTLSRFNYGSVCALHEGTAPVTEAEERREQEHKLAHIAELHDMGWTWSELGFLVEQNPDYLCNQVHLWERGKDGN